MKIYDYDYFLNKINDYDYDYSLFVIDYDYAITITRSLVGIHIFIMLSPWLNKSLRTNQRHSLVHKKQYTQLCSRMDSNKITSEASM